MRQCGQCQMCCTWLGVKELGKEAGERCQHLTPRGCAIYEDRPQSCRDFNCVWKLGVGDTSVRPDHTGAVMAQFPPSNVLMVYGSDSSVVQKVPHIRRIASNIIRRGSVAIFMPGSKQRTIFGTEKAVAAALRALKEERPYEPQDDGESGKVTQVTG